MEALVMCLFFPRPLGGAVPRRLAFGLIKSFLANILMAHPRRLILYILGLVRFLWFGPVEVLRQRTLRCWGYPTGPSQSLQGSLQKVRLARRVAEVGDVYSSNDRTHFSLLSSPFVHYSNRQIVIVPQGNINIDDHASLPTPGLECIHRRSQMSQTSYEFVGSLLRDSPGTTNVAPRADSPNMDDSQGPLDVVPLPSLMGPPTSVPLAQGQKVAQPEASKGKGSKEPPTLDQVRAKTIRGLITEVQLHAIRNHYDFPNGVKTRIPDEGENINTPTMKAEVPKEGMPPTTLRDTALFWEFLNYGLRLPASRFVDEVLVTLDRAPDQLMPFAWLVLTVFEVACLAVGVVPNLALFCTMYNVIHKGPRSLLFACGLSSIQFLIQQEDVLARVSKRKDTPAPEAPPAPKKLKRAPKKKVSEAATSVPEAVVEAFGPPSPTTRDPTTIATKCDYGLSLKWKEAKNSLAKLGAEKSSLGERRAKAQARADNTENKYQDLLAVWDGLLQSKSDLTNQYETGTAALKMFLEESQQTSHCLRAQRESSRLLLADIVKRLEELSLRPPLEAIVETFKKSDTYRDLLIDNTVSIMKEFSSKTFGKENVVELTDSEEKSSSHGSGDDEAFVEDAPREDAPVA
ncbi:hypothetical protein LIER_17908 [Lithospermum erythrorhizon]|uniref:Transposase (putative) gypsy type domain-containing protein n=1 Tax=Lithospermum erythrorhizon TaxID=34254 RepID=A0AAV3QEN7_LITER